MGKYTARIAFVWEVYFAPKKREMFENVKLKKEGTSSGSVTATTTSPGVHNCPVCPHGVIQADGCEESRGRLFARACAQDGHVCPRVVVSLLCGYGRHRAQTASSYRAPRKAVST